MRWGEKLSKKNENDGKRKMIEKVSKAWYLFFILTLISAWEWSMFFEILQYILFVLEWEKEITWTDMWDQTKNKSGIAFLKNKLNNFFNMSILHKLQKISTCRKCFIFFSKSKVSMK